MERQQSSSSQTEEPKTLVSLNSEYQAVAMELVEAGGELTPESEKRLDEAITALCEKTDGYGAVLDRLDTEEQFWKFQQEKCRQARGAIGNVIERLRDRMKFVLLQRKDRALQGSLYRYALRKSRDTYVVNENELPPEYKISEIRLYADKEKIDADLKAGKTIPGVTVSTDNVALIQGRPK